MGRDIFLTHIRNEIDQVLKDHDLPEEDRDRLALRILILGRIGPILATDSSGSLLGFEWQMIAKKETTPNEYPPQ